MAWTLVKDSFVDKSPADCLVLALIAVFPSFNKLMPLLIVMLGITLIWQRRERVKLRSLLQVGSPQLWFILFYLIHVIGLLYTENWTYAEKDLSMKLSFLILPFVLFFARISLSNNTIVRAFLAGLFSACMFAFLFATYRSLINKEDNHWAYFTDSYFSFSMHRSYFATYLAVGALMAVRQFFDSRNVIWLVITFTLTVSTLLTFSKAGILILVCSLIVFAFYELSKKFSVKIGIIAGASILTLFLTAIISLPALSARFQKMVTASTQVKTQNNRSTESSSARIIMWSTSIKVFAESPVLGVGTGDVSDALDNKNRALGNVGVAEKSLNAHNQYLNTAVQLGVIGLVPLLMIFITSFRNAFLCKDLDTITLVAILTITMLFESFLETQAGIIPVTLLLLVFNSRINLSCHA